MLLLFSCLILCLCFSSQKNWWKNFKANIVSHYVFLFIDSWEDSGIRTGGRRCIFTIVWWFQQFNCKICASYNYTSMKSNCYQHKMIRDLNHLKFWLKHNYKIVNNPSKFMELFRKWLWRLPFTYRRRHPWD
jgi:hypothetical protein